MFETGFTFIAGLSAAISAYLWYKSSNCDVPAPANTTGMGAVMGGDIITKNINGERIDFHATYLNQSKWNMRAALASAVAAGFALMAAGAHLSGQ